MHSTPSMRVRPCCVLSSISMLCRNLNGLMLWRNWSFKCVSECRNRILKWLLSNRYSEIKCDVIFGSSTRGYFWITKHVIIKSSYVKFFSISRILSTWRNFTWLSGVFVNEIPISCWNLFITFRDHSISRINTFHSIFYMSPIDFLQIEISIIKYFFGWISIINKWFFSVNYFAALTH